MFNRGFFGGMRRAGFGVGISKSKLSKYMFDILLQLPDGTANLKETIVANMGMIGQMSATRDINAAWDMAKKKAPREYPSKFVLDGRKGLHWATEAPRILDKTISANNIKKLNELADTAGCSVDQMVTALIKSYRAGAKTKKS